MNRVLLSLILIITVLSTTTYAQGYISGDLELRNDYYVRDSLIGAANTPQYDNLKNSIDSWFTLNYTNTDWGFDASIRFDSYLNSNLHNPGTAFTRFGIGRWHLRKKIENLTLTGGYFYDQFGSGLAFRAYEDRFLGIDNAIFGLHGAYQVKDFLTITAFGGVRKNRLDLNRAFVKGINFEGYKTFEEKELSLIPGLSAVNRTIDQNSMNDLAALINSYPVDDRFVPKFNNYIFSAYNTLSYKNLSWYVEAGYKTPEAQLFSEIEPLFQKAGTSVFSTLSYSKKGLGITGQFKRIENFQNRNSPLDNETILNGALNFIPPINKQNSLRLPARYQPASQEIDEMGISLDVSYKINKKWKMSANYAQMHSLDVTLGDFVNDMISVQSDISGLRNFNNTLLYKELYADFNFRKSKKFKGMFGLQYVTYNQEFYEGPAAKPFKVFVYSPFLEFTHKLNKKQSIRYELQYQHTKKDFGQWAYGLLEFNIAPKWSFSISDMWNVKTGKNEFSIERSARTGESTIIDKTGLHYYSLFTSFTQGKHRLSAAYVKQVAGIVCTGGVCRYEPAFNGVRLNLLTSF